MAAGKLNFQAADGAVIGLVVPDGLTSGERQIALGANLSGITAYHLLQGNVSATISANYVEVSSTTTRNYTASDYIFDSTNYKLYDCIMASTAGTLLTNTTYFTSITAGTLSINNALIPLAQGIDGNGVKNIILSKNETITGLTYTQGKNYVYCDKNGSYGRMSIAPNYGKVNPTNGGDFYNVITNKWFTSAGVEITNSRNYLNHIVYADNDGGVLYVEELPKIEYKDIVKANEFKGKNACTMWAILDCTTTPITIKDSYNVAYAVRVGTGDIEIMPLDLDISKVTVIPGGHQSEPPGYTGLSFGAGVYNGKIRVTSRYYNNSAINLPELSINVYGGKN